MADERFTKEQYREIAELVRSGEVCRTTKREWVEPFLKTNFPFFDFEITDWGLNGRSWYGQTEFYNWTTHYEIAFNGNKISLLFQQERNIRSNRDGIALYGLQVDSKGLYWNEFPQLPPHNKFTTAPSLVDDDALAKAFAKWLLSLDLSPTQKLIAQAKAGLLSSEQCDVVNAFTDLIKSVN